MIDFDEPPMTRSRSVRHAVSMLLTASETHVAVPSTVILILVGSSVFGLGYAWAVMKRANKDYKTTKAAVKGLRESFWLAVMSALKVGIIVGICVIVLLVWAWREIRGNSAGRETTPSPSPSVSTTHHAPTRHSSR